MSASTANDDLLLSLFASLRNAAATFGPDSTQHQDIQASVYQHLRQMQATGQTTNITDARAIHQSNSNELASAFAKITLGPPPVERSDGSGMNDFSFFTCDDSSAPKLKIAASLRITHAPSRGLMLPRQSMFLWYV
ncbi:hypothetical protein MBLNU459_g1924t1 [Dothideomycetes sp. NU459]